MGVTISVPDPRLPVEKTSPFDPAKQKPEYAFPEDKNYPIFPDPTPGSTQWHPDERQPVEIRWGRVSRKWWESKDNEETVRQWRNAFSWKAKLKAKAPKRLINGFGELYMAPPMLTVG